VCKMKGITAQSQGGKESYIK